MQLNAPGTPDLIDQFRDKSRAAYQVRTQARQATMQAATLDAYRSRPTLSTATDQQYQTPQLRTEQSDIRSQQSNTEQTSPHEAKNAFADLASSSDTRKAAAAARVQFLKMQVAMMKQLASFATGEEAQAIMRRLKHIAGQLRAAVAQYAQAGGGGTAGNAGASGSVATSGQTTDSRQNTEAISAKALSGTSASQNGSTTERTEATRAEPETTTETASTATPREAQATLQNDNHNQQQEKSRDQDFIDEVKKLKAEIEQLMRQAQRTLRREASEHKQQQLQQNLHSVDKLLAEISQNQNSGTSSVPSQLVQTAYSANLTTGIISDIQVNLNTPNVNIST
ncbi:MAG: hypothetical protein OIF57_12270 [Marinobacterium sp.]|nr:hypothetical protein [Marinobacterium sp.]